MTMQNPYIELLENKAEESYQQAARDTLPFSAAPFHQISAKSDA